MIVKCPKCDTEQYAPDTSVGKKARCKQCMAIILIPQTATSPMPFPHRRETEAAPKSRLLEKTLYTVGCLGLAVSVLAILAVFLQPGSPATGLAQGWIACIIGMTSLALLGIAKVIRLLESK